MPTDAWLLLRSELRLGIPSARRRLTEALDAEHGSVRGAAVRLATSKSALYRELERQAWGAALLASYGAPVEKTVRNRAPRRDRKKRSVTPK